MGSSILEDHHQLSLLVFQIAYFLLHSEECCQLEKQEVYLGQGLTRNLNNTKNIFVTL